MSQIAALNDEDISREGYSRSSSQNVNTKEVLEDVAYRDYHEALSLQVAGKHESAIELLQSVLQSPLVADFAERHSSSAGSVGRMLYYSAHKNLGVSLLRLSRAAAALPHLLLAAAVDSSDVTLCYKLGAAAYHVHDYRLARSAFKMGVDQSPHHWPCLDRLISTLYVLNDFESCVVRVAAALRRDRQYVKGRALVWRMLSVQPCLAQLIAPFIDNSEMVFQSVGASGSLTDHQVALMKRLTEDEERRRTQSACDRDAISRPSLQPLNVASVTSVSWLQLGNNILLYFNNIMTAHSTRTLSDPVDLNVIHTSSTERGDEANEKQSKTETGGSLDGVPDTVNSSVKSAVRCDPDQCTTQLRAENESACHQSAIAKHQCVSQQSTTVADQDVSQQSTTVADQDVSQQSTNVADQDVSQQSTTVADQDVSQQSTTEVDQDVSQQSATVADQDVSQQSTNVADQDVSQQSATVADQDISQQSTTVADQDVSQQSTTVVDQDISQQSTTVADQDVSQQSTTVADQDVSQQSTTVADQDVSQQSANVVDQDVSQQSDTVADQDVSQQSTTVVDQDVSQQSTTVADQDVSQHSTTVADQDVSQQSANVADQDVSQQSTTVADQDVSQQSTTVADQDVSQQSANVVDQDVSQQSDTVADQDVSQQSTTVVDQDVSQQSTTVVEDVVCGQSGGVSHLASSDMQLAGVCESDHAVMSDASTAVVCSASNEDRNESEIVAQDLQCSSDNSGYSGSYHSPPSVSLSPCTVIAASSVVARARPSLNDVEVEVASVLDCCVEHASRVASDATAAVVRTSQHLYNNQLSDLEEGEVCSSSNVSDDEGRPTRGQRDVSCTRTTAAMEAAARRTSSYEWEDGELDDSPITPHSNTDHCTSSDATSSHRHDTTASTHHGLSAKCRKRSRHMEGAVDPLRARMLASKHRRVSVDTSETSVTSQFSSLSRSAEHSQDSSVGEAGGHRSSSPLTSSSPSSSSSSTSSSCASSPTLKHRSSTDADCRSSSTSSEGSHQSLKDHLRESSHHLASTSRGHDITAERIVSTIRSRLVCATASAPNVCPSAGASVNPTARAAATGQPPSGNQPTAANMEQPGEDRHVCAAGSQPVKRELADCEPCSLPADCSDNKLKIEVLVDSAQTAESCGSQHVDATLMKRDDNAASLAAGNAADQNHTVGGVTHHSAHISVSDTSKPTSGQSLEERQCFDKEAASVRSHPLSPQCRSSNNRPCQRVCQQDQHPLLCGMFLSARGTRGMRMRVSTCGNSVTDTGLGVDACWLLPGVPCQNLMQYVSDNWPSCTDEHTVKEGGSIVDTHVTNTADCGQEVGSDVVVTAGGECDRFSGTSDTRSSSVCHEAARTCDMDAGALQSQSVNNDHQASENMTQEKGEENVISSDKKDADSETKSTSAITNIRSTKKKRNMLDMLKMWPRNDPADKRRSKRSRTTGGLHFEESCPHTEPASVRDTLTSLLPEPLRCDWQATAGADEVQCGAEQRVDASTQLERARLRRLTDDTAPVAWLCSVQPAVGIVQLTMQFLSELERRRSEVWSRPLVTLYMRLFEAVCDQLVQPDTWQLEQMSELSLGLVRQQLLVTLLYLELQVDCVLSTAERDRSETTPLRHDELEQHFYQVGCLLDFPLVFRCEQEAVGEDGRASWRQTMLRYCWCRHHVWLYCGCEQRAVVELHTVKCLLSECKDAGEDQALSVVLANIDNHSVICRWSVEQRLAVLQRSALVNHVEQLHGEQQWQRVVDVLLPSLERVVPVGGAGGSVVHRTRQLRLLLDSLCHLLPHDNDAKSRCQLFSVAETCIRESMLAYLAEPADDQRQMWADTVNDACAVFVDERVVQDGRRDHMDWVSCLPTTQRARLAASLVHLVVYQLNHASRHRPLPLGTVSPWQLLHRLVRHAEKELVDSATTPALSQSACRSDMPAHLRLVCEAHGWLGSQGQCTADNGALLLNTTLPALMTALETDQEPAYGETLREAIEQCFRCLYRHPSRLPRHLIDHEAAAVPLTWQRASALYYFFCPSQLPRFDSQRVASVTAEDHELFERIARLIPDHLSPHAAADQVARHIMESDETRPTLPPALPATSVTRNIFYLMADFHFKTKQYDSIQPQLDSLPLYERDVVINPARRDSWAAMALARGSHVFMMLNSCRPLTAGHATFWRLVTATERCYRSAFRLDWQMHNLWLEFATFSYTVAAHAGRLLRQDSSCDLDLASFERLEKLVSHMMANVREAVTAAEQLAIGDGGAASGGAASGGAAGDEADGDDRWLHFYMLAKCCEKERRDIGEILGHYARSAELVEKVAVPVTRRINYQNPGHLVLESLELFYRRHVVIMKHVARGDWQQSLPPHELQVITSHLHELRSSAWSRNIDSDSNKRKRDGVEAGSTCTDHQEQACEHVRVTVDGYDEMRVRIIRRCVAGLHMVLRRYPEHYKSIYRLAHLFFTCQPLRKVQWSCDLLLGRGDWTCHCHMPCAGLFSDRKPTNFFNGIWRLPVEDVDRAGSFASHMSRCVSLLIDVLKHTADFSTLLTLSCKLQSTPDQDKKYLRDDEREQLASLAFTDAVLALKKTLPQVRTAGGEALLLSVYESYCQLTGDKKHQLSVILQLAFTSLTTQSQSPGGGGVLSRAVEYCRQLRLSHGAASVGERGTCNWVRRGRPRVRVRQTPPVADRQPPVLQRVSDCIEAVACGRCTDDTTSLAAKSGGHNDNAHTNASSQNIGSHTARNDCAISTQQSTIPTTTAQLSATSVAKTPASGNNLPLTNTGNHSAIASHATTVSHITTSSVTISGSDGVTRGGSDGVTRGGSGVTISGSDGVTRGGSGVTISGSDGVTSGGSGVTRGGSDGVTRGVTSGGSGVTRGGSDGVTSGGSGVTRGGSDGVTRGVTSGGSGVTSVGSGVTISGSDGVTRGVTCGGSGVTISGSDGVTSGGSRLDEHLRALSRSGLVITTMSRASQHSQTVSCTSPVIDVPDVTISSVPHGGDCVSRADRPLDLVVDSSVSRQQGAPNSSTHALAQVRLHKPAVSVTPLSRRHAPHQQHHVATTSLAPRDSHVAQTGLPSLPAAISITPLPPRQSPPTQQQQPDVICLD